MENEATPKLAAGSQEDQKKDAEDKKAEIQMNASSNEERSEKEAEDEERAEEAREEKKAQGCLPH